MRDQRTRPQAFRQLLGEISALMVYEATRDFAVKPAKVDSTGFGQRGISCGGKWFWCRYSGAGLGMLNGILELIPHARVGFIGLKREESTLKAIFYHKSLPANLVDFEVILIDSMLATGGSLVAAVNLLIEQGAKRVRLVNLVAAPEGIRYFRRHYKQIPIYTAAVDKKLNSKGFILPGLGDAGDRLFGT